MRSPPSSRTVWCRTTARQARWHRPDEHRDPCKIIKNIGDFARVFFVEEGNMSRLEFESKQHIGKEAPRSFETQRLVWLGQNS
jgi:hypothetical protein